MDGVQLYTWCAIDALFFPTLLGRRATIVSKSPASDEFVRLTLTPDRGILAAEPGTASVSVVIPVEDDSTDTDCNYPDDTAANSCSPKSPSYGPSEKERYGAHGSFCSRVFYFGSLDEAELWLSDEPDVIALSVEDAYDLAQRVWAKPLMRQAALY